MILDKQEKHTNTTTVAKRYFLELKINDGKVECKLWFRKLGCD